MSRAYEGEKAAGKFSKRTSEECNTDDVLLCSWNSDRTKATNITTQTSKLSLLPRYPIDARNNVPCDWREEHPRTVHGKFAERWLPIAKRLLPNFEFQFFAEGSKAHDLLALFREVDTRAYILVRLAEGVVDMSHNKVPLPSMYGAQKVWEKKLGEIVPRIHFAYVLREGQHSARIIGTDAVQGVLTDLLGVKQIRKSMDKQLLCRKLVDLLQLLKRKNLQHGDLHFSNITYRTSGNRSGIESLGLIDFEYAGPLREESEDVDPVITNAYLYKLLPYLTKLGIEYPAWFIKAVRDEKDVYEAMARANPRKLQSTINYRPPYPQLEMPEIYLPTTLA